jgi:hypothetical protein
MSRMSKDKARSLQTEQIAVTKLSKRIQMLMRKKPNLAIILARAVYAKHRTHDLDDNTLISSAEAYEQSTPIMPRLQINKPTALPKGTRDTGVYTTEGGVLMRTERGGTQRDTTARHNELVQARRERKMRRQEDQQTSRAQANAIKRRHTKHRGIVGRHASAQPEEEAAPRTERVNQMGAKKNDVWYRKAQMDAKLENASKDQEKRKKKDQQLKLKNDLQGQMGIEEQEKRSEEQAKAQYDREVLQDVERWKQQEVMKYQREMQKNKHQADMQGEQRAERKRQFDREAAEKKQYDDQLVRKLERQAVKAALKQKEREMQARIDAEKLALDNKAQMRQVAKKQELERVKDQRMAVEYEAMEVKKEAERVRKLKKMSENVTKKMNRFGTDNTKVEDKRAKQNERRAAQAQEEFDRQEKEKEGRRKARRAKRQNDQHQVLAKQVVDKKQKAALEKEADRRQAEQWKEEAQAMEMRERDAKTRQKRQVTEQQDWLNQQIQVKKQQTAAGNFDGLSAVEAQMNRSILRDLGCGELHDKARKAVGLAARTRSRAEQLEQQQAELERKMLDRPAGMASHRAPNKLF